MFDPIITNKLALIRVLRRFAKHMGLSDLMGDVTSQVFLDTDPTLGIWDTWMRSNCATCAAAPGADGCSMLNPPADQIPSGFTSEKFLSGQIMLIETGRVEKCPRFVARTQDS